MKKLGLMIFLVMMFAVLLTSCSLLFGGAQTTGEYNGPYADVYKAALDAGYTDTPEALVASIDARMQYVGNVDGVQITEYTLTDGELILNLSDGRVINCGTVIYPAGTEMVTVTFDIILAPGYSGPQFKSIKLPKGSKLGTLPTIEIPNKEFICWTKNVNVSLGHQTMEDVNENTIVNEDISLSPRIWDIIVDDGTRPAQHVYTFVNNDKLFGDFGTTSSSMFSDGNELYNFFYDELLSSYEVEIDGPDGAEIIDVKYREQQGATQLFGAIDLTWYVQSVGVYEIKLTVKDLDGNETVTKLHVIVETLEERPKEIPSCVGVTLDNPAYVLNIQTVDKLELEANTSVTAYFLFENTGYDFRGDIEVHGGGEIKTYAGMIGSAGGYTYVAVTFTPTLDTTSVVCKAYQTVCCGEYNVRESVLCKIAPSEIYLVDVWEYDYTYENDTVSITVPEECYGDITLEFNTAIYGVKSEGDDIEAVAKENTIYMQIHPGIAPFTLDLTVYYNENLTKSKEIRLVVREEGQEDKKLQNVALGTVTNNVIYDVDTNSINFEENTVEHFGIIYNASNAYELDPSGVIIKEVFINGTKAQTSNTVDYVLRTYVYVKDLAAGKHTMTVKFIDGSESSVTLIVIARPTDPQIRFTKENDGRGVYDIERSLDDISPISIYYNPEFEVHMSSAEIFINSMAIDVEAVDSNTNKRNFYLSLTNATGGYVIEPGRYEINVFYKLKNETEYINNVTFYITFTAPAAVEPQPDPVFYGVASLEGTGFSMNYTIHPWEDTYSLGFSVTVENVSVSMEGAEIQAPVLSDDTRRATCIYDFTVINATGFAEKMYVTYTVVETGEVVTAVLEIEIK